MFHPQGPTFFELARQALSSTDRGYDLLAPKFEYTPFRTPDGLLEASMADLRGVERGLDVCCGTGAGTRALAKRSGRVLGVDRNAAMITEARRISDTQGLKNLDWDVQDALSLPYDAEFDVAVSYGAFGHILWDDQPAFARSVYRALRPGGLFRFVTAEPPPLWSRGLWLSRGFNAAIHLRNAVLSPPFHMYYLNFLVPRATAVLEDVGFSVQVAPLNWAGHDRWRLVTATRG